MQGGRSNRIIENLRVQQVYETMRRYGLDIVIGDAIGFGVVCLEWGGGPLFVAISSSAVMT